MRNHLFLLLLGAGVVAGLGCGDDTTATGGGGSGGGDGGNPSTGGGGNPSTGGGGQAQGGGGQAQGGDGPGGMGPGYSCEAAVGTVGTITLEDVTSVGTGAVQLKSAPGDPERLYIVKQDGQILIYEDGTLNPTPFLDVSDLIRGGVGGEEGLLGLAFHPDFATNGRFFIHYSANGDGDSTVGEFHATPGATTADPDQVQLVLSHFTDEGNHNGGAVEFGNDGYLYISLGDGGAQNDPGCDAQNLGNLLGKIIRVDVDGTPDGEGYPAAAGNPDGEKYYHVGFRNPWRMSFDVCTGDLYIGDVGQNSREEVDYAQAADGPLNFGWPMREGTIAHNNDCVDPPTDIVEPITDYAQQGNGSVTGGYVYRGSDSPSLRGWYFYADFMFGLFNRVRVVDGAVVEGPTPVGVGVENVGAFGIDGNGEVYVVEYSGNIRKIVAN